MVPRLAALLCLLALALPLAGCFVVDEIDKGQKFLDDHSPPPKDAPERAAKGKGKAADAAPKGQKGAVDAYFRKEAADGTEKTFAPGQVSEGIVACKIAGKVQFMKRENCAARGGHE